MRSGQHVLRGILSENVCVYLLAKHGDIRESYVRELLNSPYVIEMQVRRDHQQRKSCKLFGDQSNAV